METDGGGTITSILDERKSFGRLGEPDDANKNFPWGTQEEPTLDLTLSGISGTFTEGEQVTFDGTETATVVSFAGSVLKVKVDDATNPSSSHGHCYKCPEDQVGMRQQLQRIFSADDQQDPVHCGRQGQ